MSDRDVSRRSFVQAGMLGAGGLGLSELLKLRAQASRPHDRKTSVILFWLSGGPGHMETWDPKPDAPSEVRGPFGAVSTNVAGVQFGELMPELAKRMEKLAVLRSVNHGSGDHTKSNHWMLTGFEGPAFNAPDFREQRRPSMGSAVAAVAGANHPGMPAYVGVPHLRGGTDNFFHYSAYLGGGLNPFVVNSDPASEDYAVRNLSLAAGLTGDRLGDRIGLLNSMDKLKRNHELKMKDLDQHHQKAFELLTSSRVREAFDIKAEKPVTRQSYGMHTFGQSALVARRLIERGVTFVTVNCVPWDHHGSSNRYQTEEGSNLLIPPLDTAISGLIDDLENRGLYEDTMVIAMGEFGRTPKISNRAAREHWQHCYFSVWAGGGVQPGRCIGESDKVGNYPVTTPITPLMAGTTICELAGVDAQARAEMKVLDGGRVIRELV